MSTRMADIEVTTTVSFADVIDRRLNATERRVVTEHERVILDHIKKRWTGWRYESRPKSAPINVSLRKWRSRMETTESAVRLLIFNEARDWRTKSRAYVAYVRRAKGDEPEAEQIGGELVTFFWPALVADLTVEIRRNLNQPSKRQKLRSVGTTGRKRAAALAG